MALRGFMQDLIRTQDGINTFEVRVINDNSTSSLPAISEPLRYSFHDNDGDTHTTSSMATATTDEQDDETRIFLIPDDNNDNDGSDEVLTDSSSSRQQMIQLLGHEINDVDRGLVLQCFRARHRRLRESLSYNSYSSYNSPACSNENSRKFSPTTTTTQSTPTLNNTEGEGHGRRDSQRSRLAQLSSSATTSGYIGNSSFPPFC